MSQSSQGARVDIAGPSGSEKRAPKPRSCITCRARKVRCDKKNPCENCWRAKVPCTFPPLDRPPRWARRLERPVPEEIMDRLHHLEGLVKDLTGQLEQAQAQVAARSPAASSNSPGSHDYEGSSAGSDVQNKFGRLVITDSRKSRYVGSAFWSWVNDEIDGLKAETNNLSTGHDSSEDEEASYTTPSTLEMGRTPSDRHAFLFGHNLKPSPDIRQFHPLPSQVPFLLDVFSENVNMIIQVVHMPSISKMMRDLRGDISKLTPTKEALIFAIYYAAVTSMEEEDIQLNFGVSKTELNMKYRLGLEHALARSDFLNAPDFVIVQALVIFLMLARRHDSPRYVWMMTGIAIRMAIALGLQRDGSQFSHLTPFEIEMRRRLWWSLCAVDVRASEDQGTEYTIALGTFDTKMPLNINDADISPESKELPIEREGLTDMSLARVNLVIVDRSKQMVTRISSTNLEEQSRFLDEMHQCLHDDFLQYFTDSEPKIIYWASIAVARLVMAKMTLLVFLPILFSSSDHISEETRNKLLVAAIEVAEYNHALNSEQACRQWRWAFQTYIHWHAIVYLLIEISRRELSPIVERAWVALHSVWLIPAQDHMNKNTRMWIPLRRLKHQAQQHRESEIARLRADPSAVERLENLYSGIPRPSSPGTFPQQDRGKVDPFLQRWRRLVNLASDVEDGARSSSSVLGFPTDAGVSQSINTHTGSKASNLEIDQYVAQVPNYEQNVHSEHNSPRGTDLQADQGFDSNIIPWLWQDDSLPHVSMDSVDVNMELDSDVDWNNWVESAQGMNFDLGSGSCI